MKYSRESLLGAFVDFCISEGMTGMDMGFAIQRFLKILDEREKGYNKSTKHKKTS